MVLTIIEGKTLKTMMCPLSRFTVRVVKCLIIDEGVVTKMLNIHFICSFKSDQTSHNTHKKI